MEERATTAQVEPTGTTDDGGWSELGAVGMAIAVLAFLVPYVWLAIRRFEKLHRP
jgi:hypothetical protein